MTHYRTAGEQISLIMPLIFFLTNILFREINYLYVDFSIWWIFLFLAYPIAHILQFTINNKITYYIYHSVILSTLLEIFFILSRVVGYLVDIVFGFQMSIKIVFVWAIIFFIINYLYYYLIPTKKILVKTKKLKEKKRIVQISDTHAFGAMSTIFLSKIVNKIIKQKPDMVFITGDLFDYYGLPAKDSLKSFEKINTPIYYIHGNHERVLLQKHADELLENSCIVSLVNQEIKYNEFQIIGIYDGKTKYLKTEILKQKIDKELYSIVLQHKPRNVKYIAKKGVDLMLSGHTHAGQCFPLDVLLRFRWRYLTGLYKEKEMVLNVSRGTGARSFPLRLFVRNELTVIDLEPEK